MVPLGGREHGRRRPQALAPLRRARPIPQGEPGRAAVRRSRRGPPQALVHDPAEKARQVATAQVGRVGAHLVADPAGDLGGQGVHPFVVVAILGRAVQQHQAQVLPPRKIRRHRPGQLVQAERPLLIDKLPDRGQRVDQVGEADKGGLDPVVARPAVIDVQPTGQAVVDETGEERKAAVVTARGLQRVLLDCPLADGSGQAGAVFGQQRLKGQGPIP